MFAVKRLKENPILSPNPQNPWEAEAVFNGCPVDDGKGTIHLVYRALSSPRSQAGATLPVSTVGYATSKDGVHFENRRQLFGPTEEWERFGCEDPRITKIGDTYFIFYTALSSYPFSADGIKLGVAVTRDFKTIEKHPVTHFNSKAMVLFPEKIDGMYTALLTVNTDKPPAKICCVQFEHMEDLWSRDFWESWYHRLENHVIPLQQTVHGQVEIGAPPLKTKNGWLLVYAYIQNYFSGAGIFGIEAMLLDSRNPRVVLKKTDYPLLVPEEKYELYGKVPRIVFPSGALIKKDVLSIYYGAADTVCAAAVCSLKGLFPKLSDVPPPIRFTRYAGNPIIQPDPEHAWESRATFNPAAIYEKGKTHIVYRAMSPDNTSVFGYASSKDGFRIDERLAEPIYVPRERFEKKLQQGNSGCEDPRITKLGTRFYMCYTAYDGQDPPRVALTSISVKDFLAKRWTWEKPVLISPPDMDDKDAALFPKKIGGKYVFLHRLGQSIWIDSFDSLSFTGGQWLGGRILMAPRQGMFDSRKIGIAAPPIETSAGWLLLYHGISKRDDRHYHIRAALLDIDDPSRVIGRTSHDAPLLEPETFYEKTGEVSNVVFPCGAVVIKKELIIYYGGGDKTVGVASVPLDGLIEMLRKSPA